MEAESNLRSWESEAREAIERAVRAESEREDAHHEVAMAQLETEGTSSAWAQVESELTRVQYALVSLEDARWKVESELDRVQQALAASGEAWGKAEGEASSMTDERVSLLVELGASKDELSAFREEVSKERKASEEAFDAGFDFIFNYGYGCCAFAHNICGSKPGIPDGMPDMSKTLPPEFFINPRCPLGAVPIETVVALEAVTGEAVEPSSTARAQVGDNSDSLSRVAREREEPGVSRGSKGLHFTLVCRALLLCPRSVPRHFDIV